MKTYRVTVNNCYGDIYASSALTALRIFVEENCISCDSDSDTVEVRDLETGELFKPHGSAWSLGMSQGWILL